MSYWFRNRAARQVIQKMNDVHLPAGSPEGGQFGPKNGGGIAGMPGIHGHEQANTTISSPQNIEVAHKAYSVQLAQMYIDNAKTEEPKVTKDLNSALSGGAHLEGLAFKIKSVDSTARKILGDSKKDGIPIAQAASEIRDALRYTVVAPTNELKQATQDTLAKLKSEGYVRTKFKNTWGPGIYQGINANFKTPSGYEFELQFHTPESFHAKQVENHPFYEEARTVPPPSDARLTELNSIMAKNQEKVKTPPGIKEIL